MKLKYILGVPGVCLLVLSLVTACSSSVPVKNDPTTLGEFSFDDFVAYGCEVARPSPGAIEVVVSKAKPCTLILQSEKLRTLPSSAWMSYFLESDGFDSPGVNKMFWSDSNAGGMPDLLVAGGPFPGLKARNTIPLSVLQQGRGMPKTPGSLIQFSFGKGLDIQEWNRVALSMISFSKAETTIRFENFQFTDIQPSYPVADKKLLDAMGQWIPKVWSDKVESVEELNAYLIDEVAKPMPSRNQEKYSQYGGSKHKQFTASGFFRVEHDGRRWWLVDPSGFAFYSIGIDILGSGVAGNVEGIEKLHEWIPSKKGRYSDAWEKTTLHDIEHPEGRSVDLLNFNTANMIRAFGKDWHDPWTRMTQRRLVEWNVNTVGNWSDSLFIKKAKMPYVMPMQDFPVTTQRVFRDFPDVFSDEYLSKAKVFATQLNAVKDDPYLIGFFMNNEPGWAYVASLNLAEEMLANGADLATKARFIQDIEKQYKSDIQAFNKAWGLKLSSFNDLNKPLKKAASLSKLASADLQAFSVKMLERYIKVPVDAIKKIDPNHLNLGMRWASSALTEEWRFAGTQYLDVFSMNAYTDNPYPRIELASKMTNMPVLIGEFHHGSREGGHSTFGARWTDTEAQRAVAYRYYAENAASHPANIGIHYFSYNDDPVLGRFDGENFHMGLVGITHKPYSDFVEGFSKVNESLYDVAEGTKAPLESVPEGMIDAIPMTFY
ncbi:MAG: hypothetical protein ACI82O_001014 [Patiriisocius sp.]|jgi:hypothetical protein